MRRFLSPFLALALFLPLRSMSQDGPGSGLSLDERLLLAADNGDTLQAKKLILEGADVDAVTWEGATGLMFAVQNGNMPMVRLLLLSGADPDKKPVNGRTSLITAIRSGWIDIAEYLIRNGANVDLPDNEKMSPLMHAVAVDSFILADLLLYYDADLHLARKDGIDPLMLAAHLCKTKIAEELINLGADINRHDNTGRTALHFATLSGCRNVMEMLIAAGAPLEKKTISGYSPLSAAVASNQFIPARLLISAGADVNSRIGSSLNPLTLARESGSDSLVRMLRNNQAKPIRLPWFSSYAIGLKVQFSGDDFYTGLVAGMVDSKYNLSVRLGYAFRPKAIRVMEPVEGGNYYQYWERRSLYSLSLAKAFLLKASPNGYRIGLEAGFSGVMTYGKYRGTSLRPEVSYHLSPVLGLLVQSDKLRLFLDYSWLDLGLPEMSKHWCSAGFGLLINRKTGNMKFKPVNGI